MCQQIEEAKKRKHITDKDPAVLFQKCQSAKQVLDSKLESVEPIQDKVDKLNEDLKDQEKV